MGKVRKSASRLKNNSKSQRNSTKVSRFDTKLPKEQKDRFEYAASLGGYRTLTDFLISSAQEKADEIIQLHEKFLEHEKDRKAFFEALSNPSAPGKNLMKAVSKLQSLLSAK